MRRIGRSGKQGAGCRRVVATVAMLVVAAVLGSGCTVVFRDPGVTVGCGPLRYMVTTNGVSLTAARRHAIDGAVAEFARLVGRPVARVDSKGATAADSDPGDPILIELAWPEESPDGLGFAHPHVVGRTYAGGWIRIDPTIRNASTGLIRRLVLHELGHLHGLDDVDDTGELMDPSLAADRWGPGDLIGLALIHDRGCPGARLSAEYLARLR